MQQEAEPQVNKTHSNKILSEEEERTRLEWEQEQETLKTQLITFDDFDWSMQDNSLKYIGGVDISFNPENREGNVNDAVASLVVCSYPDLKVVYEAFHRVNMNLPYIPGYLGFREVPHLVNLVSEYRTKRPNQPLDVILIDGNGVLHPRGFGLASHLGVLTGVPTVGVAKNLLYMDGLTREKIKEWTTEHLKQRGDAFELCGDSGVVHGAILKGADTAVKPVYVSIGHKISLKTSIDVARFCCKFRIPEPVRQADLRSRDAIRDINKLYDKNNQKSN